MVSIFSKMIIFINLTKVGIPEDGMLKTTEIFLFLLHL